MLRPARTSHIPLNLQRPSGRDIELRPHAREPCAEPLSHRYGLTIFEKNGIFEACTGSKEKKLRNQTKLHKENRFQAGTFFFYRGVSRTLNCIQDKMPPPEQIQLQKNFIYLRQLFFRTNQRYLNLTNILTCH